jgi:CheY-like chemotaxis protein
MSLTILVVDDNDLMREMMKDSLLREGHNTVLARDGQEALSILIKDGQAIDLVISDLQMPVMNGQDLRLAMLAKGMTQPFILMTATPDLSEQTILAMKLNALLIKPCSLSDLKKELKKIFPSLA